MEPIVFEHVDAHGAVVKRSAHIATSRGDAAGRSAAEILRIMREDFQHST